jgi:hypothetical protein
LRLAPLGGHRLVGERGREGVLCLCRDFHYWLQSSGYIGDRGDGREQGMAGESAVIVGPKVRWRGSHCVTELSEVGTCQ